MLLSPRKRKPAGEAPAGQPLHDSVPVALTRDIAMRLASSSRIAHRRPGFTRAGHPSADALHGPARDAQAPSIW